MTPQEAIELLEAFRANRISRDDILRALQTPPVADLGFARVDLHRSLRQGFPEVIFGLGKTPDQVLSIAETLLQHNERVLATRLSPDHARKLQNRWPHAVWHETARCVTIDPKPLPKRPGIIAVVSAGTSDLPVAEEAAITAEIMGNSVLRIHDVGVAGLHRLFSKLPDLQRANVLVVVAGMEGALPSVVGGLVRRPIIAVPTSVGYGAHFGGLAALLAMLNSCASGITVVNIDNGFGAGFAASQINALVAEHIRPDDLSPSTPPASQPLAR
ncbi:MAG: nickel pincer cofactor biosynthesis protein LarB [Verrucomicrobiota bacterium]|nr:nickel pincer cofactor biosynthesis protein LarB [Limisphaera sp.]MDW8382418.1 nickel pincer cofactor biosynthesis protein LarB [Verrucomicrobiota bacterium]